MKKLGLLTLTLSLFALSSCVEAEKKEGNEDLIPNVKEDGVRGSWSQKDLGPDAGLVLAREWYIETARTTIATRCDFAGGPVVAAVRSSSKINGSVLTIQQAKNDLQQVGEQLCYAESVANSSYTLNLVSPNVLRITRAGTSIEYTRINPIDEN